MSKKQKKVAHKGTSSSRGYNKNGKTGNKLLNEKAYGEKRLSNSKQMRGAKSGEVKKLPAVSKAKETKKLLAEAGNEKWSKLTEAAKLEKTSKQIEGSKQKEGYAESSERRKAIEEANETNNGLKSHEHPIKLTDNDEQIPIADKSANHFTEDKRGLKNIYPLLQQACATSEHMRGRLRQQQANIAIELPDALPSTLLVRALQKSKQQYRELTLERIAPHEQPSHLSLVVDGLSEERLYRFIAELDELIGQFIARN